MKFSLRKSSREKLFTELKDANDRMRNLLESNDQITAARQNRDTNQVITAANKKFGDFWHALRLHGALSKAWQCGCDSHGANLQLQHTINEKTHFDVIFDKLNVSHDRGWLETKIEMLPDDLIDASNNNLTQGTPQMCGVGQAPQSPSSPISRSMTEIQCLCNTLLQTCSGCFGFIDEDGLRFGVFPGDQGNSTTNMEVITLEHLFANNPSMLTRRRRYGLALSLASSYLQLLYTPWLPGPLKKDNILFFRDVASTDTLPPESAYIRSDMSGPISVDATDTMSVLGIRLLELCFGTSLENNVFRQQLPPGDAVSSPILDRAAAFQWSKMVIEEAGPEFADAVDWCLRAKEPTDGSWKKRFWMNVIVPLEYCHKQVSQRFTVY